jgi:hypothetical protein
MVAKSVMCTKHPDRVAVSSVVIRIGTLPPAHDPDFVKHDETYLKIIRMCEECKNGAR